MNYTFALSYFRNKLSPLRELINMGESSRQMPVTDSGTHSLEKIGRQPCLDPRCYTVAGRFEKEFPFIDLLVKSTTATKKIRFKIDTAGITLIAPADAKALGFDASSIEDTDLADIYDYAGEKNGSGKAVNCSFYFPDARGHDQNVYLKVVAQVRAINEDKSSMVSLLGKELLHEFDLKSCISSNTVTLQPINGSMVKVVPKG